MKDRYARWKLGCIKATAQGFFFPKSTGKLVLWQNVQGIDRVC